MNLLKNLQTNWKYILIVVVLGLVVGGGLLWYQWWQGKQEVVVPSLNVSQKEGVIDVSFNASVSYEDAQKIIQDSGLEEVGNLRQWMEGGVLGGYLFSVSVPIREENKWIEVFESYQQVKSASRIPTLKFISEERFSVIHKDKTAVEFRKSGLDRQHELLVILKENVNALTYDSASMVLNRIYHIKDSIDTFDSAGSESISENKDVWTLLSRGTISIVDKIAELRSIYSDKAIREASNTEVRRIRDLLDEAVKRHYVLGSHLWSLSHLVEFDSSSAVEIYISAIEARLDHLDRVGNGADAVYAFTDYEKYIEFAPVLYALVSYQLSSDIDIELVKDSFMKIASDSISIVESYKGMVPDDVYSSVMNTLLIIRDARALVKLPLSNEQIVSWYYLNNRINIKINKGEFLLESTVWGEPFVIKQGESKNDAKYEISPSGQYFVFLSKHESRNGSTYLALNVYSIQLDSSILITTMRDDIKFLDLDFLPDDRVGVLKSLSEGDVEISTYDISKLVEGWHLTSSPVGVALALGYSYKETKEFYYKNVLWWTREKIFKNISGTPFSLSAIYDDSFAILNEGGEMLASFNPDSEGTTPPIPF